jgi:hypothetical protein
MGGLLIVLAQGERGTSVFGGRLGPLLLGHVRMLTVCRGPPLWGLMQSQSGAEVQSEDHGQGQSKAVINMVSLVSGAFAPACRWGASCGCWAAASCCSQHVLQTEVHALF